MSVTARTQNDPRSEERGAFLRRTPFARARVVRLGSDASIRQYFRLEGGPAPALLMDAPDAAITPPCPPAADEAERCRLGYAAMVRGSGNALPAFRAASRILKTCGLVVPEVYDLDAKAGFCILEDFGTEDVATAALRPGGERRLYLEAADTLDCLRGREAEAGDVHGWTFQTYDRLAYESEAMLLSEWYLPKLAGRTLNGDEESALLSAWREALAGLSPPRRYVHRDFHAQNLMVTSRGLGVLDFQDMMIGQAAYDWASLIEDARRDVDPEVRVEVFKRGVHGADDPEGFIRDFAILAAQRNAKILGLFARLACRDGKSRYLDLLPRVRAFFREDLAREPLRPVRDVLESLSPELVHG